MFDLHTRLHRLIYPRCYDGLSSVSDLNLVSSRKLGKNLKFAIVIKMPQKDHLEETKQKVADKCQKITPSFIRYLIAAYKIDMTFPFSQRLTNNNKIDITIDQPSIDCVHDY